MAGRDIPIFDFDETEVGGGRLDVLLDAIDSDPVPSTDPATLPSLVAFFNNQQQQQASSSSNAAAGPSLSISSLLAASQQLATPDVPFPPSTQTSWFQGSDGLDFAALNDFPDPYGGAMQSMERILRQTESAKRDLNNRAASDRNGAREQTTKKNWDETNIEERWEQIRTTMRGHALSNDGSTTWQPPGLSTILCLHSDVAQKSYGTEKRYLSPPPMVRIQGPLTIASNVPTLTLSAISPTGEVTASETSVLHPSNSTTYFHSLHITASAKAKSFSLQLSLSHPPSLSSTETSSLLSLQSTDIRVSSNRLPFATFFSSPLSIVSKPSKKTSRARSTISCILAGSPISLLNRINSQTARTKYMSIDSDTGRLRGRSEAWSAFSINVVRRSEQATFVTGTSKKGAKLLSTSKAFSEAKSTLVSYGSEVRFTDLLTGLSTETFRIYKVEQNKILLDIVGPLSQGQKVAFGRETMEGRPIYLSSSKNGLDINGRQFDQLPVAPVENGNEQVKAERRPNKRKKVDSSAAGGTGGENEDKEPGFLTFQAPEAAFAAEDGSIRAHQADDFISWTVGGCASFSYSFFNAYDFNKPPGPGDFPITPFPTITAPPEYHLESHSLKAVYVYPPPILTGIDRLNFLVSVANFFYQHPATQMISPLEIWLGPLGPLKVNMDPERSFGNDFVVEPAQDGQEQKQEQSLQSDETRLSISLPSLHEMFKAGEELTPSTSDSNAAAASASSWMLSKPSTEISSVVLPVIIIRPTDGTAYMTQRSIRIGKVKAVPSVEDRAAKATLSDASSSKEDWRVESQQHTDSWQVKIL